MILISIILALIIERLGARAPFWQAEFYVSKYQGHSGSVLKDGGLFFTPVGFMVWLVLPALLIAFIWQLSDFILWQFALNICVLLVAFGCADVRSKYKGYLNALSRGDNEAATLYALQIGQRRTEDQKGGKRLVKPLLGLISVITARSFFGSCCSVLQVQSCMQRSARSLTGRTMTESMN